MLGSLLHWRHLSICQGCCNCIFCTEEWVRLDSHRGPSPLYNYFILCERNASKYASSYQFVLREWKGGNTPICGKLADVCLMESKIQEWQDGERNAVMWFKTLCAPLNEPHRKHHQKKEKVELCSWRQYTGLSDPSTNIYTCCIYERDEGNRIYILWIGVCKLLRFTEPFIWRGLKF